MTRLCAEARERIGVLGVDRRSAPSRSTAAGRTTSWSTASTGSTLASWATEGATLATEGSALAATEGSALAATTGTVAASASATAALAGRLLDEALVDLDDLLLLALARTLGLAG